MSMRVEGAAGVGSCVKAVCNAAFCLKHVVTINYAGKTVLVLFGIGIGASPSASPLLRVTAIANAVGMLLGQFWYTVWWDSDIKVQKFVAPSHSSDHGLHSCIGQRPHVFMFFAAVYYAAFTFLYVLSILLDDASDGLFYAYAVGAAAWHGWCGALLLLSACLAAGSCASYDGASVDGKSDPTPMPLMQAGGASASSLQGVAACARLPRAPPGMRGLFKIEAPIPFRV